MPSGHTAVYSDNKWDCWEWFEPTPIGTLPLMLHQLSKVTGRGGGALDTPMGHAYFSTYGNMDKWASMCVIYYCHLEFHMSYPSTKITVLNTEKRKQLTSALGITPFKIHMSTYTYTIYLPTYLPTAFLIYCKTFSTSSKWYQ